MHPAQVFLGGLDALTDGRGHFLGFPDAVADHFGGGVADYNQRRKAEILAALHHLGDAVDGNHLLLEVEARRIDPFDYGSH